MLPISKNDLELRGWYYLDFIIVTGDAYIDHSSFGIAIISRWLEKHGYKVGVISQPNWSSTKDFMELGRPRYGFLISGGNIDSMVNHYTVAKKKRIKDNYSPGGVTGKRPDRASIVYSNKVREAYGDIPIILGGLEASLRRLAHYDYWSDSIYPSILIDSKADIIVYGMGEKSIIEIATALKFKIPVDKITNVKGTVYKTSHIQGIDRYIELPSYKEIKNSKKKYAQSFMIQYENTDIINSKILVEKYDDCFIVQNTAQLSMTTCEMDRIYALPFTNKYHPIYEKEGGVPAINEVRYSIVSNRGCFGSCNFCALTFHQGRVLQTRSHESIIKEATAMSNDTNFKGYIHDVGGPTANFRTVSCEKQKTKGMCKKRQCLFPKPCGKLKIDHSDYAKLLVKLQSIPKVKKVFIRSGIRYDYLLADKDNTFFNQLCKNHISGQLKVAPEHVSDNVLQKMGKPTIDVYKKFECKFKEINKKIGKEQYLVPYLMSSHPGSTLNDAIELAQYLHKEKLSPEQVQDFYPTPGTLSTCMYYTGIDPRTMQPVYIPKTPHEKAMQRALIQYKLPQNYDLVYEALQKAGRYDLIGYDKKCLIRPRKTKPNITKRR